MTDGVVLRPFRPTPSALGKPWGGTRLAGGAPGIPIGELWLAGPDSRLSGPSTQLDSTLDLDRSIIDRFLVTPVHRSAIIGGLTIYQLASLVIQAAIIGGLALLLGAHFEGGLLGYGVLTLCAMLLGASVASFSDAMALTLRQRESVIGINTLITLPLTFLSAAFIPLALAPEWIRTVARYNPVNWAVEAGREPLTATPDWSFVFPRIAGLLILAVLATGWATRTFRSYQRSI
jgi:ABC-2 type transport system permease protein